jgi:hypothetical protein
LAAGPQKPLWHSWQVPQEVPAGTSLQAPVVGSQDSQTPHFGWYEQDATPPLTLQETTVGVSQSVGGFLQTHWPVLGSHSKQNAPQSFATQVPVPVSHVSQAVQVVAHWPVAGSQVAHGPQATGEQVPLVGSQVWQAPHVAW